MLVLERFGPGFLQDIVRIAEIAGIADKTEGNARTIELGDHLHHPSLAWSVAIEAKPHFAIELSQ
jgi:hypothetical protein